jgi:predicted permease
MRMEHWWYSVPLRLRSLFRRGTVQHELDEELQFHLDQKIEEGIASGLSPEEARFAARHAMGGLEQRKEETRDTWRVNWWTDFVDDVRYAVRSLARVPGMTVFVVITLAIGIGITAGTFSMVDSLVFRPYPVPNPHDVVTLAGTTRDNAYEFFSYREYLDIRNGTKSYDGVIANKSIGPTAFSAEPGATPRVKSQVLVSGNFFRVLGVEPRLGRGFREDEDQVPGRNPVVVLGRDCWKVEFASDPSVVGRSIRLNGVDFTVIGVAPESFPGMQIFMRPDFYVPLAMAGTFSTDPSRNFFEARDARELLVRARLENGTTIVQARSEMAVLARDFQREYPQLYRDRGAKAYTPFEIRTRSDEVYWKFGLIFNVLALAVLLVACTNVAGLLLARAATRTREIAVRLALGAGRSRLIRMLLTESLLLALLGGLAGVVVGYGVIELFRSFSIPSALPVTVPFRMDVRVLIACLAMSVVSAILCGLAPALQSTRRNLVTGLKTADVDMPGRRRLWGRNALVVAQVSTSLMLLTASLLMMRGFRVNLAGDLESVHEARDHVLLAGFDPRLLQYDAARTQRFYDDLVDRARGATGVQSVGLTLNPPLGLEGFEALSFVPEGLDMPPGRATYTTQLDAVDEGFFATMGVPLVRGRGFLATDTDQSPRVAVVNQQFAQRYWPGSDALGKRFRIGGANGPPVEIVGITETIRYSDTTEKPTGFVYFPVSQHPVPRRVLLLKSAGSPLQLRESLKQIVHALDPDMPMIELRTYDEVYRYSTVEGPAIAVNLVSIMGGASLLLAIAGLYGLVAYNVSRRTREIGIRMAIGATPSSVLRLVLSKGVALVATGTVIGLAMGFALERLMNAMLFNAGGVDFATYALVVPVMFVVTMLAAYVPARRAAQIEPTRALRYE